MITELGHGFQVMHGASLVWWIIGGGLLTFAGNTVLPLTHFVTVAVSAAGHS